jgi:hypothetical protein
LLPLNAECLHMKAHRLLFLGIIVQILYIIVILFHGDSRDGDRTGRTHQLPIQGQSSRPLSRSAQEHQLANRLSRECVTEPGLEIQNLMKIYHDLIDRSGSEKLYQSLLGAFANYFEKCHTVLQELDLQSAQSEEGILITVGKLSSCSDALIGALSIRGNGNIRRQVPINIVHYGPSWCNTASLQYIDNIRSKCPRCLQDVTIVDLSNIETYPMHHLSISQLQNFEMELEDSQKSFPMDLVKAMALYFAPFKKVLMIDAGVILLQDPQKLLGILEKSRTSVFWPEVLHTTGGDTSLQVPSDGQRVNTAFVLLDRLANRDVLEWYLLFSTHYKYLSEMLTPKSFLDLTLLQVEKSSSIASDALPSILFGNNTNNLHESGLKWVPFAVCHPHPLTRTPLFLQDLEELHLQGVRKMTHISGPISSDSSWMNLKDTMKQIELKKKGKIADYVVNHNMDSETARSLLEGLEASSWSAALDWSCADTTSDILERDGCWYKCLYYPEVPCGRIPSHDGAVAKLQVHKLMANANIVQGFESALKYRLLIPFIEL